MSASFDILTEPWIPVVEPGGGQRELGLLDVLERAHTFQAVRDASPLVEYSLYRFLILFLMDALRPEDGFSLSELLEEGCFAPDTIRSYVSLCRSEGVSFDLFDRERPFLQTNYRPEWDREPKPVSTLNYAIPHGNNHIHFDHQREQIAYTPGQALRMLLAAQIFCTAGAQGYPSNVNGAPPWFSLICGENLFETLVFSMIGLDRISLPVDEPPVLWRSTEEVVSKKQVAQTSWLYGMLFPARRIHLIPEEGGSSVSAVYFSQGMNNISADAWTDPHVTYRLTEKGRFNWKPSDDEAIWRNLRDLINTKKRCAPQILEQYSDLFSRPGQIIHLVLYGVQTNKASYLRAQRHDLRIPDQVVGNELAVHFVTEYIALAERLGGTLYRSLRQKEIPAESRTQARQRFYGICEQFLWRVLEQICQPEADLQKSRELSVNSLISAASDCAVRALRQLSLRGRTMLRVMELQQKVLGREIAAIREELGK